MFDRLRSFFETRAATGTLRDPWTTLLLGGGGPTAAGVEVSPSSAMRCSVVFGAVKVQAESLQQLPLHLYRRTADGGRERATDHWLAPLLSDAANPWMPASEFRLVMQTALSTNGNAYAFINRDRDDRPTELIPLDGNVSVEQHAVTMEPRYTVTGANGQQRVYDRRQILHLRGIGTKSYEGLSPVVQGREAIGLAMVLEKHGAGLFGRGARPGGVLKYPGKLTKDLIDRLRVSFDSVFRGGENAGKTAILEDGMDFTQLALSSVDAQFQEMRKFQVAEVSRFWRVPLHLLNDLERVTHNNAEQMGSQFLSYCLLPILETWTGAISITLLTPEERKVYYPEFLVDDLARADLAARFTAYSQAVNAAILNPNEVRQMENRGPYAGGEVYMRPVNTAPAPSAREPANAA